MWAHFGGSGAGDPLDEFGLTEHSLRFRSDASSYLSRTFGTPTDNKKYTFSCWVKRSNYQSINTLFNAYVDANNFCQFHFRQESDNGRLEFFNYSTGYDFQLQTNALFRDPSSHYHVILSVDTAQATASDRVKIYCPHINSSPLTLAVSTYPALNFTTDINAATRNHYVGQDGSNTRYLDGYLSRICFVDGAALTPDSFGQFHPTTGQWRSKSAAACKAVVDAGGTNSFILDFNDGTSLTTLGNDFSSKNNDWTLNNHSLTAGVTYDWMLDTPTNSFAGLNPIWPSAANISYANLRSGTTEVRGTIPVSNSYWEVTAAGSNVTAGVVDSSTNTNTTTVTANKVFGFRLSAAGALDYINITDAGSWTSITTGLTGDRYAYGTTAAADWNFGQRPFSGTVPTGFKALCTKNLPLTGTVTVSGSFTGNASADGPFVWCNGSPETLTINSNAVTFGTHADRTAGGFKLRTSSSSYNAAGSNSWTATILSPEIKSYFRYQNARGN